MKITRTNAARFIFLCSALLIFAILLSCVVLAEDQTDDPEETDVLTVVYVKDGGSDENDGLTPKAALKTLKKAYEAVSQTGGKIIVSGKLTLDKESANLPSNDKDIEITSIYEGIDYRSKGKAEILFDDTINILGPAKTTFSGIKLHSVDSANIFCNGSNVVFGTRVENVSDTGTYPSIWGGSALSALNKTEDGDHSDFSLEVNGGYWHHVTLGNLRTDNNSPMSTIKDASLTINGGTYVSTDNDAYTCSLISGARPEGKLSVNINAGIFYGSFYAIGNEGRLSPYANLKYNADIEVNIADGSFLGNYIKAIYNQNSVLFGKYNFSAKAGSFSSLIYVGCEGVMGEITLDSCNSLQNKLYGFEKVVYVSSKGDDGNSGENASSPKKSLSDAINSLTEGGTVVVMTELKLQDGFTLTNNDHTIKITTKYFEEDYSKSNNARLNIEGKLKLNTNYTFDDITLYTEDSCEIICYGKETVFDSNVNTVGKINITLWSRQDMHSLKICGGEYDQVLIHSSELLSHFALSDGKINSLSLPDDEHKGKIFIDISGGTIASAVDLGNVQAKSDVQLIVGSSSVTETVTAPTVSEGILCEALVTNPENKAKILGFEFIEDKYIFVSDNGCGDGSTPSNAISSYEEAIKSLGSNNATIVICGKYTHTKNSEAVNSSVITLTSNYRNIDLAEFFGASLLLKSDFHFYNDATIKEITVVPCEQNISFVCNSKIVIFGYGIKCEPIYHSLDFYPSIKASDKTSLSPYDTNGMIISDKITIMGGIWYNVYGSAYTHINGSVIKGSVFGSRALEHNTIVKISNGVIYGGVYGAYQVPENSKNDITLTFIGGEIHGTISPSYKESRGYGGKYVINISDGNFSAVDKIQDATYIGGEKSYAYVEESYDSKFKDDNFVNYQNPISTSCGSINYLDGYWYLFSHDLHNIYVYRSISLQSIHSNETYYKIEIESEIQDFSVSLSEGKFYVFIKHIKENGAITSLYASKKNETGISFSHLTDYEGEAIESPYLFYHNTTNYLYYSKTDSEGVSGIYCVALKDNYIFDGEASRILTAQSKWEKGYLTTPRILKSEDGTLFLCYTGGDVFGGSSMIGIASVINRKELLSANSYIKDSDPAFYEDDVYSNVVLCDFVAINGNEPYMVYSARVNKETILFMHSFAFDNENKPYLNSTLDLGMLYLSYYKPSVVDDLLYNFKINFIEQIPDDIDDPRFSLSLTHEQILLIVIIAASVIILIILIVLIKKLVRSVKRKNKTKNASKTNARRQSSKKYLEYLNAQNDIYDEDDQDMNYVPTKANEISDEEIEAEKKAKEEQLQKAVLDIFGAEFNSISGTQTSETQPETSKNDNPNLSPETNIIDDTVIDNSESTVEESIQHQQRKRPRPKRRI